jgi:hypothetical protein
MVKQDSSEAQSKEEIERGRPQGTVRDAKATQRVARQMPYGPQSNIQQSHLCEIKISLSDNAQSIAASGKLFALHEKWSTAALLKHFRAKCYFGAREATIASKRGSPRNGSQSGLRRKSP